MEAEASLIMRFLNAKDLVMMSRCKRSWERAAHGASLWRCSDLSQGLLPLKLPLAQLSNKSICFPSFVYQQRYSGRGITVERLCGAQLPGCNCAGGKCRDDCACADGFSIECHDACACSVRCGKVKKKQRRCLNRQSDSRIERHLAVVQTLHKGWALKSLAPITCGDAVVDYFGELISNQEAVRRGAVRDNSADAAGGGGGNFVLSFDEVFPSRTVRTCVDASRSGSAGRFVNHSCEPNLEVRAVRQGSFLPTLVFWAVRDIASGEELTMDYGAATAAPRAAAAPRAHTTAVEDVASTPTVASRSMSTPGCSSADLRPWQTLSGPTRVACHCESSSCRGFLPFDP
jgi:hypothetical protein